MTNATGNTLKTEDIGVDVNNIWENDAQRDLHYILDRINRKQQFVQEMQRKLKKADMEDNAYVFYFSDNKWANSTVNMSFHRTKAGAYRAMRRYIIDAYTAWFDDRIRYGRDKTFVQDKFGLFCEWGVKRLMLQD